MRFERTMNVRLDPHSHDQRVAWIRVLEQAEKQLEQENPELYGSGDRGHTIGQSWHMTMTMFGIPMVCVLVEGRPSQGTESIPVVVRLSWPQLRHRMRRFFEIGGSDIVAFVHDGRSGHGVNLLGREGDRIIYEDPWPGESLLCRHQNAAGIDAREHGEHQWTITEDELARVLVGVHIWPSLWAEAGGKPGALRYSKLRDSEFWSFFGIHERTGADGDQDGPHRTVHLSTGGFTDKVALELECDGRDRITCATLQLREDWAVCPPWGLNPFALDIARSFMGALIPLADRAMMEQVLPPLSPPEAAALLRDDSRQGDPSWQLMAAYVGGTPDIYLRFSMSALKVSHPREGWIRAEISTF
ncbi:hypothetical protein [Streptomyces jumonjinensis]|uniref:Uncharacterized protein n=1 Tax=Streptomyces jumonjinensis TaxID=1945 RepID=A0A646KQZ3_STRJU|nr:hypothetical protein [Streptomyces jumonjinensis]MQT03436.1 hypothetical protein [Streptomyces jumonjinensis]